MKNVTRKKERRPKTVANGRHSVPRKGRSRVGLQGRDSNPQPLGYEPSELPVALPCYKNLSVSCAALKRWASAAVISWSSHTTNHHERNAREQRFHPDAINCRMGNWHSSRARHHHFSPSLFGSLDAKYWGISEGSNVRVSSAASARTGTENTRPIESDGKSRASQYWTSETLTLNGSLISSGLLGRYIVPTAALAKNSGHCDLTFGHAIGGVWIQIFTQLVRPDVPTYDLCDGDHIFGRGDRLLVHVQPIPDVSLPDFTIRHKRANRIGESNLPSS